MTAHLDFHRLKASVSIARVLEARGVHLRREGHRLVGPCPVHRGDNPRAFIADLRRNLWYCFTGCGGGGDVIDLVRRLDGGDHREAARVLAQLSDEVPPEALPEIRVPTHFQPFERRLSLDPLVPWLRAKGIRPETARRFEAGYWPGRGWLAGCVGVRLHDRDGHPLGYAGRRLDPQEAAQKGKWKLPPGLPRRDLLYNAHRVPLAAPAGVVVVECAWGVMRLAQLGVPAVALLGTSLSPIQHRILDGLRRIVLLLDGDPTGRRAAETLAARLTGPEVHLVRLPDGADPDDLNDTELGTYLPRFSLS